MVDFYSERTKHEHFSADNSNRKSRKKFESRQEVDLRKKKEDKDETSTTPPPLHPGKTMERVTDKYETPPPPR